MQDSMLIVTVLPVESFQMEIENSNLDLLEDYSNTPNDQRFHRIQCDHALRLSKQDRFQWTALQYLSQYSEDYKNEKIIMIAIN